MSFPRRTTRLRCAKAGKAVPVRHGHNLCGACIDGDSEITNKGRGQSVERRTADRIDGYDRDDIGLSEDR